MRMRGCDDSPERDRMEFVVDVFEKREREERGSFCDGRMEVAAEKEQKELFRVCQ